jgi:hypothetical protein
MNIAASVRHSPLPDWTDVFQGELAQRGDWVVANVSTSSFWPMSAQKVRWRGVDVWILPLMKNFYPAIAMRVLPGQERTDCEELLLRFLSTLSWVEERGYLVEGGLSAGDLPRPMGRNQDRGFGICFEFNLSYFPEVANARAMVALGLMREGRGLNHVGYAFLSFYKILEKAFPSVSKRIAWISSSIAGLTDLAVKTDLGVREALDRIRAQGITSPDDIGAHLYKSGRCAIAHASRRPIVDPDNPEDLRRLGSELPIVRALAVKAIEEVFGVETRGTIFRKHLYELDGFKKIFGRHYVTDMQSGVTPAVQRSTTIPRVSVRIRRRQTYAPLEGLRCKSVGHDNTTTYLDFESVEGDVRFRLALDFAAERMQFDCFADIDISDTGSANAAERVHEIKRFLHDYFGNGELQIFNTDTGELIGRKDAFVPMDVCLDDRAAAEELVHWKAIAEQRREVDRKFAEALERNRFGYSVHVT